VHVSKSAALETRIGDFALAENHHRREAMTAELHAVE
jgi:hypothetical protein